MKLGWNIAAGFGNAAGSAVVILLTVPFLLRYLGVSAYGLIGFFTSLQVLFGLFDVGLGPTINREVARASSVDERARLRDLLHTLALVYGAVAALIALIVVASAPWLASHWLRASALPTADVIAAVSLMGLVIACRFPLGLYLGALIGAGKMVTASGIEIAMVILANVGGVLVLAFVDRTLQAFFVWQAVIGAVNLAVVRLAAWRALRGSADQRRPRFDVSGLRRIWRFSAGMGATAVLGAIFLQSDKVILSRIVSLEELGRYTLAGIVAKSLYVFIAPVFTAVYPRLTALHAAGDEAGMKRLYKNGSRALMAVIFPSACFVGIFAVDLVTLWTGNAPLAHSVAAIVILLLTGNTFHAAMHFPYALQLASGKSDMSALISVVLLLAFAPLIIVLAGRYGIEGAAASWTIFNVMYFVFGTWLTHRSLLRGTGRKWIVNDIGLPMVAAVVIAGLGAWEVRGLDLPLGARLLLGAALAVISGVVTLALSPDLRRALRAAGPRRRAAEPVG